MVINMTFSSKKDLEKYLLSKMEDSVLEAQNIVYSVLEAFINNFYDEYDPVKYNRTFQLYKSLVKSKIEKVGNGYKAVVYFDASQMNHIESEWSDEQILETAAIGSYPHGGYPNAGGNGILNNAMPIISQEAYNWLKQALKDRGIPIKE